MKSKKEKIMRHCLLTIFFIGSFFCYVSASIAVGTEVCEWTKGGDCKSVSGATKSTFGCKNLLTNGSCKVCKTQSEVCGSFTSSTQCSCCCVTAQDDTAANSSNGNASNSPSANNGNSNNNTNANTNASANASGGSIVFANPIAPKTVEEVGMAVFNNMQGYLGVIAVVILVIGGIMYMLSAGNESMITKAKTTIGGALIGLAIILAAPTFIKEIKIILNAGTGTYGNVDQAISIKQIATNVLTFLLSIFGIISVIALVIGGIMYVTAYGDEGRIESGKKILTYALIGTVVGVGALILAKQLAVFFMP